MQNLKNIETTLVYQADSHTVMHHEQIDFILRMQKWFNIYEIYIIHHTNRINRKQQHKNPPYDHFN